MCDNDLEDKKTATTNLSTIPSVNAAIRKLIDEAVADFQNRRGTIEQAKGMIMLVYGLDSGEAFDYLVSCSQRSNSKVCVIADRIVAGTKGGTELRENFRSVFDELFHDG